MPRPVQPLPNHPQLTLSNLKFYDAGAGREGFSVDWKLPPDQQGSQWTLIIRPSSGGNRLELTEWFNGQSGTFSGTAISYGTGDAASLKSGCEAYVVQKEGDLEFKISNSLTSGNAPVTQARPATPEEKAKFERPVAAATNVLDETVEIPKGFALPVGTAVKMNVGDGYVDAVVIEPARPGTPLVRVHRSDINQPTMASQAHLRITPEELKRVKQ